MSRIGIKPIEIPAGVTVAAENGLVTVKGKLGELSHKILPAIAAKVEDGQVVVARDNDRKEARSFHGLTRSLIANMIEGVSNGYTKSLEIEGVGFRMQAAGQIVTLSLGYASPKEYKVPEGVQVVDQGGTKLTVSGIDKQLVGRVAADIRAYYPAEPYKGKGIRYTGEVIRRKEGKTVA